ncbi:hypothetical protein Tco_0329160 [Tanacetum coccineum]
MGHGRNTCLWLNNTDFILVIVQRKEKAALRDEVSAARQEGLSPGWELDMIAARQKKLPARAPQPAKKKKFNPPAGRQMSWLGGWAVLCETFLGLRDLSVRMYGMDTLSLVLEYLKNLEECMDDRDSWVAKEMKLLDALEHKSIVIEVGNQKFAIFTKAPLRAFDSTNYVTKKVLDSMGFVHVSISDYGRKIVNDVNVEIHGVKFKADFVMNLTMFKEVNKVIDLLEEIGSSSEEVVKMGKVNRNKGYNINKLTPISSLKLEEIPSTSTIPPQPIYYPLTSKQREKTKEVLDIRYKELEESKPILEVLENYVIYKKKLDEILIVGKDEDGNAKYGLVAPLCLDIEDDMERALAMEAYFNPFKNIIVFKKLVDFLGSLPVQLKNIDWGNEGYGTYKKIDGDGNWHARFEIVTPSGRKFNRAFKTKTTTRKLSGNSQPKMF